MRPLGDGIVYQGYPFRVSHAEGLQRPSNQLGVERIAVVGRILLMLAVLFLCIGTALAESPSSGPSEVPSYSPYPTVSTSTDVSTAIPSLQPSALFPRDHAFNSGDDGDDNDDIDDSGMSRNMRFATVMSIFMAVVVLAAFAKALYSGVIVIQPTRVPESNTIAGSDSSSGEWGEEEW